MKAADDVGGAGVAATESRQTEKPPDKHILDLK